MIKDIEVNGKAAKRARGGIHCKYAGAYVGYLKSCNEANKVKNTKSKKNRYKG